jgi:hypothetical protein
VFTTVGDSPTWRLAGLLHINGIGRYGIQGYGADSRPRTAVGPDGVEHVVNYLGYEERGTLALNAERVAHKFLRDVEYAAREAAKTDEERAAEDQARADRDAVQEAARAFIAKDLAGQRDRYQAHLVRTAGLSGLQNRNALDRHLRAFDALQGR